MQTRRLGPVEVSAIGLGAMPLSIEGRPAEDRAFATVHAALDAGVTLIDTADAYCLGHDDFGHGEVVAVLRELGRDGGQDDALLDAVQRGVQEGAERRPLARHPRVAPVERVADRPDDEGQAAEHVVVLPHEHRGDDAQREPRERDRVRGEPRLDQPVADEDLVVAGGG